MMPFKLKITVEILFQIAIKELDKHRAPLDDLGNYKMPKS